MITDRMFLSFLHCCRKAYLKTHGCLSKPTEIETVQLDLERLYRRQALEEFIGSASVCAVIREPSSLAVALRDRPRFIVNATVTTGNVSTPIPLLERVDGAGKRGSPAYTPVLFVRNNKISRIDKLLLAFNASALASVQGAQPPAAKIVHGDDRKVLRVKVEALADEVRQVVALIETAQSEGRAPLVTLNRHCNVCEFHDACRKEAEEKDDLSLLRALSDKEMEKLRSRGITTVTQFSHSYRPGRRGKRKTGKARKHDLALQALAVREKKVYVLDSPQLSHSDIALYLDVEGVPDLDFYYLIGLVAVRDGVSTEYSFWADDRSQVKGNWDACARVIEESGDYTLYHYGSYEQRFLDRMAEAGDEAAAAVKRIRARSCNVLSTIYSHVYFPIYSNGLKDIGTFLGARWSAVNASGIQSLAWRLTWEASKDEAIKQRLLIYNREDCLALRRVTEFVLSVSGDKAGRPSQAGPAVASVEDIPHAGGFRFGRTEFFCPELAHITKCAYADHQRDKVYLRTDPAMRKSLRRKQRVEKKRHRVNEEIACGRPDLCPECGGKHLHSKGWLCRKIVSDIKITPAGVKRWVVRYSSFRYRCCDCQNTFFADVYRTLGPQSRLGENLAGWTIYNHVALRLSYEDITLNLHELFGFSFGTTVLHKIKGRMAERHRATYERMKEKLRRGNLIHADETKVLVKSHAGYVWAFTNMEEVIYVYTPTREGTILEEMLEGFNGILVSDYYSAYDSPKCKQQKCLIHLMRDINDDIFHNPFDEDLKQLAQRLVAVLKAIIDTIDRFGLKHHHLNKHKEDVASFFGYLSEQAFGSEVARKYQTRLKKCRDKLFVFLDHDGIPWNNNNAENAIKRFASRRKLIGASFTEKGLKDYLVFLSIYQTCRHKNLSFLRFLRSGTFDIDAFGAARGQ